MEIVYYFFSIRLTVAHRMPVTWWSPGISLPIWHTLGEVRVISQMRVILGESRLPSLYLSLSLSAQCPGEVFKSCCPLVVTEHDEEAQKEKRKKKSSSIRDLLPLSPLSLCLWSSLFLCLSLSHSLSVSLHVPCCSVILRDASEGDHLLIHLSPALLPVPLPPSYRWWGPGLSLAHLLCCCQQALWARRVCCWGWGRRLCPLGSDSHKGRK